MPKISNDLESLLDILIGKKATVFISQIGSSFDSIIRFNPIKGDIVDQKQLLEEQGFKLIQNPLSHNIFRLDDAPFPIGKTISHFLGHIYVQDLSSMVPPIVLNPDPGDYVLDVSAAPGSKTTQLAALMENEGVLISNDADPKRVQALSYNMERMGAINSHVINTAGERLGRLYPETFDKILLDPPCSGIGTLHKNPEILGWWDESYSTKLSNIQYRLFLSAVKALKPGGTMVYSTCTITPWENEWVVQKMLDKFPLKLINIPDLNGIKAHPGLKSFKKLKFSDEMNKTLRIYPHENNSEGFFIAHLEKTETMDLPENTASPHRFNWTPYNQSPVKKYVDMISEVFEIDKKYLKRFYYSQTKQLNFINKEAARFPLYFKPVRFGLPFCKVLDRGAKLTTESALFFHKQYKKNTVNLDKNEILSFANRENIFMDLAGKPIQKIVKYKGNVIGHGFYDGKKLRSNMPKGEWKFIW